jgi:copper chaperone CopZ
VPDDFFVTFAAHPLLAMIAVVMIAIPMYVCATGSIPIALSLILKGLTPGTAFVFLMAGPAVNFASYTLLSRTIGHRNTLIYIAIIALSAIAVGLGIDDLLPASWFMPRMMYGDACCMHQSGWFDTLCSIILSILLIYSLIIKRITPKQPQSKMAKEYQIDGMMCVHCKARVKEGLAQVEGVTSVSVDLSKKIATVEGAPSDDAIKAKVLSLGYTYVGPQ